MELTILLQQWLAFSFFLSPPPARCWVLMQQALHLDVMVLPRRAAGALDPPIVLQSLGHSAEVITEVPPGPWVVAAATAVVPGSGRTAPAQQLLHRREQFPWISLQFPWISKALNLFSPEPQLSVFGCRKKESGIKKRFIETEFTTDFFVYVH